LVGERWALLIVRELVLGPKRFTDLRVGLPGLSPNVLAQRLRELEAAGIVERSKLPPPAASRVYELTERGRGLAPVLIELGCWGAALPTAPGTEMSLDSHLLALQSTFDPEAADGIYASYELRLDGQSYRARVADGELRLARGTADKPHATLETEPRTLLALLWGGLELADAIRSGETLVAGDRRAIDRFLRLFPAPEPAPPDA
jgi:DNA-binding HxlR family transcriptional regulator